ncbi:MAG: hypothetical protein ACRENJ_00285 [Candidatus Eiseniibacteriota bacterium]
MRSPIVGWAAVTVALGCLLIGCGPGPALESIPPPPAPDQGLTRVVVGASDSVGALPGSPNAQFLYRFRQIDPASDRFVFQDRELSFYFKPTPDALHVQIENRQDRPVWIVWERSTFFDPNGGSGKVAHITTRWDDRFKAQPDTQIPGLQRYTGDYLLPLDYLFDPAGHAQQTHRPLFPEDHRAPQYADKVFGVDLAFMVEERPRTYAFRFRVVSVIPR